MVIINDDISWFIGPVIHQQFKVNWLIIWALILFQDFYIHRYFHQTIFLSIFLVISCLRVCIQYMNHLSNISLFWKAEYSWQSWSSCPTTTRAYLSLILLVGVIVILLYYIRWKKSKAYNRAHRGLNSFFWSVLFSVVIALPFWVPFQNLRPFLSKLIERFWNFDWNTMECTVNI